MASLSALSVRAEEVAGGQSAGLRFVSMHTARGWVLAADATHFYENMESGRPFTTAFHIGEMLAGFDRLRAVAGSDDLAGIIVRLDERSGG